MTRRFRAPGRVNLIGEHTDYTGGLVLPMAIGLACYAETAPTDDGMLTVIAEDLGETRIWPVADVPGLRPAGDWRDYVIGVAQQLMERGIPVGAQRVVLRSTVPIGAGLSSSAALEVAAALALSSRSTLEAMELVRLCHRAECDFVGLPCGIMDQFISVFGVAGSALRIDCRDWTSEPVQLPPDLAVVAADTGVKHELSASAYQDRVRECAEAEREIGPLRDAGRDSVERLTGAVRRRARHVVTENERVLAFCAAAAANDPIEMGRLMTASHRSLQHDYEVSCGELDQLVEAALTVPGVYGARMTGGGFGGATVNLMRASAVRVFEKEVGEAYARRHGSRPGFHLCEPAAGACEVSLRVISPATH